MNKREAHRRALKLASSLIHQAIDAGGWTTFITSAGEIGDMYASDEDVGKIQRELEDIACRLDDRSEGLKDGKQM